MHAQHRRNFLFFDAPVGLIFSIDRDLELGSWLDYGMFLQSIMVAARQFGLETCPQAAFLIFYDVLQRRLGIPPEQQIVCGMSLGYPDPEAEAQRVHESIGLIAAPVSGASHPSTTPMKMANRTWTYRTL